MFSLQKILSQKFHAQQLNYNGKRASEVPRKRLFITTKPFKMAANHPEKLTTKIVLSQTFRLTDKFLRLTRSFHRLNGTAIIMRNPSESSLRGTPRAIIMMHPRHIQWIRPHDLNMKGTSDKNTPRNIIMQRRLQISRARNAKSRQTRVTLALTT